jgi:cell division protein FtsB
MPTPASDRDRQVVVIQQLLADKRRRLGLALQQLAADLAQERRRNRELERELAYLRDGDPTPRRDAPSPCR